MLSTVQRLAFFFLKYHLKIIAFGRERERD